eukprot:8767235-Pyramimonas_sp.AAC.1
MLSGPLHADAARVRGVGAPRDLPGRWPDRGALWRAFGAVLKPHPPMGAATAGAPPPSGQRTQFFSPRAGA